MNAEELGSVLIAEVGSVTTRVVLVDVVEGEIRLINRAEKPSTIEPPYQNAAIAILEAVAQISELTGRKLLREGQLLMPQTNERDGVNYVVATSSAAGTLSLIIAAIATDISARSALHACHSTYTSILQVITLDDFDKNQDGNRISRASGTSSWIEHQVETMLTLNPDAVVIAGGLEGGAVEALSRLAHIVGLSTSRTTVDTSGQQRQDMTTRPVMYAGNSAASQMVEEVLMGRAETIIVENVRPSLEQERLEPARREVNRLYETHILPQLPGFSVLQSLCNQPVTTVCSAEGLITRFLAERYNRQVLTLDIGSTSSSAFLATPGHYVPTILGNCGTGYGLMTLLAERGVEHIARWLPFSVGEKELTHWILNKFMRPHVIPASREDVLLEHAIARETLIHLLEKLAESCPTLSYDLVVAGGGVLSHAPHPGLAALTLLDALQPTAEEGVLALDLHLDIFGLLPACGTLARMEPDAAVTLFDRDVLRNMPLATCVVALGEGKPGKVAIEAELAEIGGQTRTITVHHGEIGRLPLLQGLRGTLTLRPAPGVRIGRNAPGVEVRSDLAAISGSALGVVIDARGRPLLLPANEQQRHEQIWKWLTALEAEEGTLPYTDAAFQPEAVSLATDVLLPGESTLPLNDIADDQQPAPQQPTPPSPSLEKHEQKATTQPQQEVIGASETPAAAGSRRISLADLDMTEEQHPTPPAAPPPAPPPPGSLESDLASLRETVAQPEKKKKKRGIFGKKEK